jgi:hypothetical protein
MRNLLLTLGILSVIGLKANNIAVTNVSLAGQNVSAGVNNAANFTYIEFDLSWDNSWRTSSSPVNWDAAWVFVKYRTSGSSTWNHVKLAPSGHNSSGTGTSYSVQVGLTDESIAHSATTNPAVGAFIYRSANGTGSFSASDIRLKWFYRDNGVGDNDIVDVDVYAIEMVWVPDGSFWLGDNGNPGQGGNPAVLDYPFYKETSPRTGFEVTSESSILTQSNGGGSTTALTAYYLGSFTLPSAFPKGYTGFYCMKYECSQQQYVDFLNSLSSTQQANRAPANYNSYRQMITSSAGVYSTTLPSVPTNSIHWMDHAAYLDWAGLRPMTELEFEKAARGTATAVTDEYAWGNTSATAHTNSLTNGNTSTEVSATSGANFAYQYVGTAGPIRVGAFANSGTSRTTSGASFYGIMELSGNLAELVATVSNGTTYSGVHGDGSLTSAGHGDVTNWPGLSSGAITGAGAVGATGTRGGGYGANTSNRLKLADRWFAGTNVSSRDYLVGIRGLHTKPRTTAETK